MKAYKCDLCGDITTNPYKERIREFKAKPIIKGRFWLHLKKHRTLHICASCWNRFTKLKNVMELDDLSKKGE